jgi:hypothetical protein
MSKIQSLIAIATAIAPYVSDITAALKAIWALWEQNQGAFDITPQAATDPDAAVGELVALGVDETAARELIS